MSLNDEMARQTAEQNTNELIDRLESERDRYKAENRQLRIQVAELTSRCEGAEAVRDHYRAIVVGAEPAPPEGDTRPSKGHDMVVCGSQPEEAFEARNTWDDGSLATFTPEVDDTVPAPPPVETARVCTGRCVGRAWEYLPCQSGAAVECQVCKRMINGNAISEQDWEDGVDRCGNGCVWHLCQG